ncbi:hypothetical protein ACTVFP_23285, partial [Escherichia coli]|uniref:hypothetical protein n=1 Tax=Escherichia coli TaxID=562 RepID=UPI003FA6146D
PNIESVLDSIINEYQTLSGVAHRAIAEHSRQVALQKALVSKKLDLKDDLVLLSEDLEAIARYPKNDQQAFSVSLVQTQIESLKRLIRDYFDTADIDALKEIQSEMSKTFPPVDKALPQLGDEFITEQIKSIQQAVQEKDQVVVE